MKKAGFSAAGYKERWQTWSKDPMIQTHGFTFDMTPAGEILAPEGKFRVCAYHVDWDERPRIFMDVSSKAEVDFIMENFYDIVRGRNVDFGVVYDDKGKTVVSNCPY